MSDSPSVSNDTLIALLYQAVESDIGILLQVSDLTQARARFYKIRADLKDPVLECLQFRASPFEDGNLVIIRTTPVAKPPTLEDF